ncbi:MAG TPA: CoA transferase [Acidimicrobiales bacterium]|nr:CoA transferase [Acidimicrobiales bacterium]
MSPPLAGVRVLDLGRIYQGPWAGLLMAMAGAEVVKVEPPGGEPARGRAGTDATVPFAMLNSNKSSITLDLKHRRGRQVLVDLASVADVLLENFAPGVMDGLGLGPDLLLEANPRLVYGSATGFGVDGPDRDRLAMDITVQAHAGVMSVTGFPEQPPVKAGVAFVDFLGGTHLYAGVVTALYERERTGRGRVVDVAMVDAVYPTLASNLSSHYQFGTTPRTGNRHGGQSLAPYNAYPTSDGWVAIIVITEDQWRRLTTAMGRPELGEDERYLSNGRRVHRMDEVEALVQEWTAGLTRAEVLSLCRDNRVPASPVREVAEVVEDPHLHERGAIAHVNHPVLGDVVLPRSPIRYRGEALPDIRPSGALGADTDSVLRSWLGMDDAEVAQLRADGVISSPGAGQAT